MVSHNRVNHRQRSHNTSFQRELNDYWDTVLRRTARVIQRMTVPQLVRLVSDDIFAVKTGCDFLENDENTMDLHVNQLIRIVVEEKLNDYLRCEDRILRQSSKVERKLDQLMKIKQANKSIIPRSSPAAPRARKRETRSVTSDDREYVRNTSHCCIM